MSGHSRDSVSVVDFEAFRRARTEDPNRVRCAHCGRWIFARATRCTRCGLFFEGEAFQFPHPADELLLDRREKRPARVLAAAVLLTAFCTSALFVFFI